MKRLHESLAILHKCYISINTVWKAIEEHIEKGAFHSVHHFTQNLAQYILLETTSFREEYNKFLCL